VKIYTLQYGSGLRPYQTSRCETSGVLVRSRIFARLARSYSLSVGVMDAGGKGFARAASRSLA